MKGVVAYDTYYGNTKLVAEAIAEEIRAQGHEAEVRSVKDAWPPPQQGDILFVGSPVRFKKVTRATKRFVNRLDRESWKGKPVVVFTTVGKMPGPGATEKEKRAAEKWIMPGAAVLRDFVRARGLNAADEVLRVEVKDWKGPLVDEGIEQTKAFVRTFLRSHAK